MIVLCRACSAPLWKWTGPPIETGVLIRTEFLVMWAFPPPLPGTPVETCCPSCGGAAFGPPHDLRILTEEGLKP